MRILIDPLFAGNGGGLVKQLRGAGLVGEQGGGVPGEPGAPLEGALAGSVHRAQDPGGGEGGVRCVALWDRASEI